MALFNKFDIFVQDIAHGQHDLENDQLVVALSNTAPDKVNDIVIGDIIEIDYTNLSSRNIITTGSGQVGGEYSLNLSDLIIAASSVIDAFRYVIIYNSNSGRLIGWYDYGNSITMDNEHTLKIGFIETQTLIEIL